MRGSIELPDGGLLLPLCDAPRYRAVFHVTSSDNGENWSAPTPIAEEPGKEFEEPAGLMLDDTRILMMLRENRTRILHRTISEDGGRTWSAPVPTGIPEYPCQLLRLVDGRVACVAGRRIKPFGIVFHVSDDGGFTWNPDRSMMVRDDLPNSDLGYPTAVQRGNGDLLVVYYAQDDAGITGIYGTLIATRHCG